MSLSHYTRNILNIKDENINFEENCLEIKKINNKTIKVFHGKLTYTPEVCPNCGCLYESNPETIIKYGFKKNCKIKTTRVGNFDTILLLESCLGEFTVLRMIAPSEITAYAYKTDKVGKYAVSRKDALLEFLIEYYELYKDTVPSVFSNQLVG